jgi:hypothetical protein
MTRMAGSVRTARMAGPVRTIRSSLALGLLLGCSVTGPCCPRRPVMSPAGATTLAQTGDWGTSSCRPRGGSPGVRPRSVSQPAPMTPNVSCGRIPLPRQNLESPPRQARRCDGIPDCNSGGDSGAAGRSVRKWGRRGRESEIGSSGKGNSSAFFLESWPRPGGVSLADMIIRASGALPDRDGLSHRKQASACEYPDPGASHGREVKAGVDASTHPHHPNGRACPTRKDDSCYPVFRSNQYL